MRERTRHLIRLHDTRNAHAAHAVEKIAAELDFANTLCELHPAEAPAWRTAVDAAFAAVEGAAGSGVDVLLPAVQAAEEALSPLAATAKTYTMYCAGHAHIDMNWMWSWPETVAVTLDTFATVLLLMEEFPTFHFSQSQASVYAIVEKHAPDLLERIRDRVKEGRWEVTASHWVEGDKNIADGEALCRHLLYTRRYMQRLFGLTPADVPVDWSPDTFGHAATVPTYLVRGGVKYLYLHRPGAIGPKRPGAFRWQAPDGSRVLVRNDMVAAYNGVLRPDIVPHLVSFSRETGLRFCMYVYGVGDHGGGPTRRDLLRAVDMDSWPVFPNITFAPVKTFFDRLDREGAALPTLDCELNSEFTGCYTSQALIKRSNRFAEKRLVDTETAAVVASRLAGHPYPSAALETAWRDTLFSHFHDILPGSGVHDTRTFTHGLYQQTMATLGAEETRALRALAARVDTSHASAAPTLAMPVSRMKTAFGSGVGFGSVDGGISRAEAGTGAGDRPMLLFNPLSSEREEIVEATIWDDAGWGGRELLRSEFSVRSPDGRTVAAQVVDAGDFWGHRFVTVSFPARLASLGYAVYTISEKAAPVDGTPARQTGLAHHCPYSRYERSPEGLDNGLIRLDLDPATGGIRALTDLASGIAVAGADGAPALEFAVERPHGMSSWLVDHTGPVELPHVLRIERKLSGPYRASLEVGLRIRQSEFTLTYEVRAGDPKLYLHITGMWLETGSPQTGIPVLRLAIPMKLSGCRTCYEIPFGTIERDMRNGEEVSALRFAQVSGVCAERPAGCLLLNDSKHGHAFESATMRLNLIRASYEPDPIPEVGRHEIHCAIQPFAGVMPPAAAIRTASAFNRQIRVVATGAHTGDLPAAAGLVSVSPASLVVSALKQPEDGGRSLLLRLYNPGERAATARIKLNAALLGKVRRAVGVDILEQPDAETAAELKRDTVSLKVARRGLAAVRIDFNA